MTPDSCQEQAAALCATCHVFGERQWCLATSGNFSLRVDRDHCLITQSGKEKSTLRPNDLMICDMRGHPLDESLHSSAETALHACLYRHDDRIAAVLHTHSVASTVMSRRAANAVRIGGFEMQKALRGVGSHEDPIEIPVLENSQDMQELSESLLRQLQGADFPMPAFLIRGHGLYAWGHSLAEAQRHIEGVEFLLQCLWQEVLAGRS